MNKKYLLFFIIIIVIGALVYLCVNQEIFSPDKKEVGVISSQEAADKAINYINEVLLGGQATASLVEVIEENGLYKLKIKIMEQEFDSYITRNGKLLFPEAVDLENNPSIVQEVPKKNVPDVKLFIMSYCPFGLQAQKAFLPVYDLLKDKAEIGIYFVNYAMHDKPEIDENLRQYCIQKEQTTKFYNYLSCFTIENDFNKCLSQAEINRETLNSCVLETDIQYNITSQYSDESTWLNGRFPKFDIQSDLNEKYQVQGSPTFIINDKLVDINPRSPEHLKNIICEAFSAEPEECGQILSEEVPSSGFGEGVGSSSDGSCE